MHVDVTTASVISGATRTGRPRDTELTDRLLAGALDIVADRGVDRLNADALATATGAGKAAIYRRWPTTGALLAEVVRRCRPVPATPDAGSLRADLTALLEPWTRALDRDERAVAAVLGRTHHDPDLRAALEVALVRPLDDAITTVVDRHAAVGDAVSGRHRLLLARLVRALWWERYVAATVPRTDAEVETLVDRALLPILRTA